MSVENRPHESADHKRTNKKDNAKQAFIELANAFGIKSEKSQKNTEMLVEASTATAIEAIEVIQSPSSIVKSDAAEKTSYSPTIISDSTIIIGNIQASGDVDMQGELKGDVSSGSCVLISGKIEGNITAKKDIDLKSAHIQGNIKTEEDIKINKTSVVIGDICAKNITLNGHVKGKISVEGLVLFQGDAMLLGDVSAGRIAMEEGAQLAGSMSINQEAVSTAFEDIQG